MIIGILGLTSCSLLPSRHPKSGYYETGYEESNIDFYSDRQAYQWNQTAQELGIDIRNELTEDQRSAIQTRIWLRRLEKEIASQIEREQYYQVRPYLKTDSERIQFLNLRGYETKSRWISQHKLDSPTQLHSPHEKEAINLGDIFVGMSSSAVAESWGEPRITEVAGNPIFQNFRWIFERQVPTEDGYTTETRTVYFESGRVIGWETN